MSQNYDNALEVQEKRWDHVIEPRNYVIWDEGRAVSGGLILSFCAVWRKALL